MSGPGDRAPKPSSSREPTQSSDADGHGVTPTSVDVASTLPPGSEEFGKLRMIPAREPGDLVDASLPVVGSRQPREGDKPQAAERVGEESDAGMVPKKSAKTRVTPVESMEGRAAAEGKSAARNAPPAQDGKGAFTFLQRIGKRAKQKPKEKWTNLLSHIKVPLLKEAYQRLRRNAAAGVDEVTWVEYGERFALR